MIYLIDDKKIRQEKDFSWNTIKFDIWSNRITPIFDINELIAKSSEIFKAGNTVMYHESFLSKTSYCDEATEKRLKLDEFASNNKDFQLVIFSGSKFVSPPDNNVLHISATRLYQNLELFIKAQSFDNRNLELLVSGAFIELEKEVSKLSELALDLEEDIITNKLAISDSQKSFTFVVKENGINFSGTLRKRKLFDKDITDIGFNEAIKKHLNAEKYEAIYLPLSVGPYKSEFSGLRLATYLRCSDSVNQLSNIIIYGYVDISLLIDHDYFDIIKTKNVALLNVLEDTHLDVEQFEEFDKSQIPDELSKLNLKVPKRYYDDHGIANEWGLYHLARCADIPIDNITEFDQSKLTSIYFKWLLARKSINSILSKEEVVQQKEYRAKLQGLKIIDKIDLNKFK